MNRDDPTEILAGLIWRVPIHAIDLDAARRAGDDTAVAYAAAIEAWRREAAQAIAQAMATSPRHGRHVTPDAYARTATVSALMRPQAAE